jgi:hypothetical protein
MRLPVALAALCFSAVAAAAAPLCHQPASVCPHDGKGSFALIRGSRPAALYVDAAADPAVRHAADSFAGDLMRVSGHAPERLQNIADARGAVVIVGVLGRSAAIDALVRDGKIKADDIAGRWEAFRQIVVAAPFPGVARALVIVGADRRGAVFGAYDISEKIGVSPLTWFADVPAKRQNNVFVTAGARRDAPKVRYRGFFINDEAPSFSTWAQNKFGGANAKMYAHVFEYLLRMKGNYLWPAMWDPRAFDADDPENMVLADAMGVVMGTSHHEPMTRAHDEWHRDTDKGITGGKWDYTANAENLRAFWRGGIERMMSKGNGEAYENVVTVGMRGDGDEPMAEGTAISLLEGIVADQRKIIADVTGKPAGETPQVWALYKEVQDYYDHGMTVPDDVTLLFCDDNWGQNRRLPTTNLNRKGGYGVYYHFDYVGGPRNYKWINTNQIEKTWQQMDLAYASGARALWVVNVGDIKPMEFPLGFFMKQAWDPEAMTPDALKAYPADWARATFGPAKANAIGALVTEYSALAARRKPELIDAGSFPLGEAAGKRLDGGEFGAMTARWQRLERKMLQVKAKLPPDQRDSYFELVEHPILALSNLYQLYYAAAWNRRLAAANDPRANIFADKAEAAFRRDQQISDRYNAVAGGKWDGMMLQTHIGYTTWQQPDKQIMPAVKRVAGAAKQHVAFAAQAVKPKTGGEVIAVEAPHFSRAVGGKGLTWRVIPHLGRTLGAVLALPQGLPPTAVQDGVRLEYDIALRKPGAPKVALVMVPAIDTRAAGGIKLGVSVDDGPVQTLAYNLIPTPGDAATPDQAAWIEAVENNAHVVTAQFPEMTAGRHVLKIWRLDDNAVLQKLVVSTGETPASYLGPEETLRPKKR